MKKKEYFLRDYPSQIEERLRYRDTDSQGHINNAVYVTLFEVGRTNILFDPRYQLRDENTSFMVAHIGIDYLAEVKWPNTVTIGTRLTNIGRTSLAFEHVVFDGDICAAVAKTVIVKANKLTRQTEPLSDKNKQVLEQLR